MAIKSNLKVLRTFLVTLVALSVVTVLGYAALLSYYGRVIGTVNVAQSLQISNDGSNWKTCRGGNYNECTITYDVYTITAGDSQQIPYKFYIKNNANSTQNWDYVYFKWKYTIPENLLDGLTLLKVDWTTYSANAQEPESCNKSTTIPLNKTLWNCTGGICTIEANDMLGEGMIQKFCNATISLRPDTIPDTYNITIEIIPTQPPI